METGVWGSGTWAVNLMYQNSICLTLRSLDDLRRKTCSFVSNFKQSIMKSYKGSNG